MSEPGAGPDSPWMHLLLTMIRDWGAEIETYDAPPGGPVTFSLLVPLPMDRDRTGPVGAWARSRSRAVWEGWAIHEAPAPGPRFAIGL